MEQVLDTVSFEIMQQAFEDSGLSWAEAGKAAGYSDGSRLSRKIRDGIDFKYEDAARCIKSWHLDPVDYGV